MKHTFTTSLHSSSMERSNTNLALHHTLFITLLIIFIMFFDPSESAVYTVGEDEKWSTGVNFLTWSQKYNFSVGDFLVFEYLRGEHDVYDVTNDAYRSCNETDGVFARYRSGNDTIELKEAKKYWFICNIPGHCFAGMRLKIEVYAAAGGRSSPSRPPPQSTSPESNYSNKNGGRGFVPLLRGRCEVDVVFPPFAGGCGVT